MTRMVTLSWSNNNNFVPRNVDVQHRNSIMPSDSLFSDMDIISIKSNHVDLVSPSIQENSHASPHAQEKIPKAHRYEDRNFDPSNCYPNSEMTNEELSVILTSTIMLEFDWQWISKGKIKFCLSCFESFGSNYSVF